MSDDSISRQAAIYNLARIAKNCAKSDKQQALMGRCIYMIEKMPSAQHNPEKDRQESKDYCSDCEHVEMCSWYPTEGCEFRQIKPEQKTGRWIYMKDCEDWFCSNCKDIFMLLEGTPKDNDYNYCPNCGAFMEG